MCNKINLLHKHQLSCNVTVIKKKKGKKAKKKPKKNKIKKNKEKEKEKKGYRRNISPHTGPVESFHEKLDGMDAHCQTS